VQTATNSVSDEDLAQLSQAGSLPSFEELVYRHEGRIFGLLLRCCRNESQAEELTQITFVTAYRSLHLYDPAHPFGPWLSVIARRKFIDHCRKTRLESPAEGLPEPCDLNDPATVLEQREQRAGLWDRVRQLLGGDQFSVLWLKYQEDLSIREIARLLKRTETSVKVLLFRARQALVRGLAPLDRRVGRSSVAKTGPEVGLAPVPRRWEAARPANLSPEAK
jgi:RNA polymerase sigma-70 factor, ECF subfamily